MDCSLLVRLHDMHVERCPVIEFGRFVIRKFEEVESGNSRIQLRNYTFSRVTRQLDGAQPGPRTMFKEEASKGCLPVFSFQFVFSFSICT